MTIQVLERDKQGRQHIKVGKYCYTVVAKMDFFRWANVRRGLKMDEVTALRHKDKEKLFLTWKWGFTNDNTNYELESSRRDMMMSIDRTTDDFYFKEIIKWENLCFEIKKQLGLAQEKKAIDYIVEDRFSGTSI